MNVTSLLSLLPPSCIIVPVREVVDKHCSFSSTFSTNSTMTSYPSNVKMCDIDNSKFREYSAIFSKYSLREFLILLNTSSIPYYRKIEINNELPKEDSTNPVNSSQLSYMKIEKVGNLVSLATNKEKASNSQHINNKVPTLKRMPKPYGKDKDKQIEGSKLTFSNHISNNVYNIQITYNIN